MCPCLVTLASETEWLLASCNASQRDSGLANLIIESSPLHRQLDELLSEESARYAALVSETKYLLNSCRAMEHASDLANLRIEPSPTAQTIR